MKDVVNQRFIDCINYLLDSRIEPNKAQISLKLQLKPSMFSEILNKRVNVNVDHIIGLCDRWIFFNAEWIIIGTGTMIKDKKNSPVNNVGNDESKTISNLNALLELRQDKIKDLENEIKILKSEIQELKNDLSKKD